jgi:hypothetical protein
MRLGKRTARLVREGVPSFKIAIPVLPPAVD